MTVLKFLGACTQELRTMTGWLAWAERSRQTSSYNDEAFYLLRRLRPWRIWSPHTWLLDLIVFVLELRLVIGFRRYFLPSWWRKRRLQREAGYRPPRSVWRKEWNGVLTQERKRMVRIEAQYDEDVRRKKGC